MPVCMCAYVSRCMAVYMGVLWARCGCICIYACMNMVICVCVCVNVGVYALQLFHVRLKVS